MRRQLFLSLAKTVRFLGCATLALLCIAGAYGQSAYDGFTPGIGVGSLPYVVLAVAVQDDGKIVIGGDFTGVDGQTRNRLARLNVDGSLDAAFAATDVDGPVTHILVMPDRRIVIAGSFEQVGLFVRHRLARLNADGSVDAAFDAHLQDAVVSGTPYGNVRGLALQSGKLIVGGVFASVGGSSRANLARLLADGSADAGFEAPSDTYVTELAVQADSRIVIAGQHADGQHLLERLSANGAMDADSTALFDADSAYVAALALQPDGKILVGGYFSSLGGQPRNCLARLLANGSVDADYVPAIDCNLANADQINSLTSQSNGRLIVTGQFTAENGSYANRNVTRLLLDGSVDGSLAPALGLDAGPYPYALAVAIEADGNVLIGGGFASIRVARAGTASELGQAYLARLDANQMAPLTGNHSGTDGGVYALALQADGRLLIGGDFDHVYDWGRAGGPSDPNVPRARLARLNPDQSLDSTFAADVAGFVQAIAVQADGKILVGGNFNTIGGVSRNRLARLNADGTIDPAFDPDVDSLVYALAVQGDGSILVGGAFQHIGAATGNHHIPYIARLHADGSVDAGYDLAADGYVYSIAMQADGSALLGGDFTALQSLARNHVARIVASGAVDPGFDPGPGSDGTVYTVTMQPDGKVIVGGTFGSFANHPGTGSFARLNTNGSVDGSFEAFRGCYPSSIVLQADGRLVVAGTFYAYGGFSDETLLRLNADGSADPTYAPSSDGLVYPIALQSDGQLVAGGNPFMSIGGQSRADLARLNTPQAALQTLNFTGNAVSWLRSGSAAELTGTPILEFSVAGSLFVPLGAMHHVAGGWRYDGFSAPAGQAFFLRARASLPSGSQNGSSGRTEIVRWFGPTGDAIFTDGFE